MQIRAFLADDERAARARLRRLLDRHPQIEIIGEAANGLEAVEAIERLRPELLFLDVRVNDHALAGIIRAERTADGRLIDARAAAGLSVTKTLPIM